MNKLYMLLVTALVSFATYSHAQINAYTFSASSGTYANITGGTSVNQLLNDAGYSTPIPIGFDFVFNGVTYNQVIAAADGYLSFNTSAFSTPNNNLATSAAITRPLLAPLWDDLSGFSNTSVSRFSYVTTGLTGSRIFTAEWKSWRWGSNFSGNTISFQVKLYEGSNKIDFIYRPETGSLLNGSASIGIAGSSGGNGNFLSLNSTGTLPGVSSSVETPTLSAKPATGQVYSFTPPPAPSVDVNISNINTLGSICPSPSFPVIATIKNAGTSSIDFSNTNATFTINITGALTQNLSATLSSGILASGATRLVTLSPNVNFPGNGTYNFTSTVTVAGDGNTSNDTTVNNITIASTTVPWAEPFATASLPAGWQNTGWAVGTLTNANVTGNPGNCIFKNLWSDSAVGTFTTLSVGLVAANSSLAFDYKLSNTASPYSPPAAGWGNYKVQVSTDCGASFTTIDSVISAGTGWVNKAYSLAAYTGHYVSVRIVPKWSAGSYYLAFDNFSIVALSAIDLATVGANTATLSCTNLNSPVTVTIKNNGTNPIDFTASNALVTVNVTGPLNQTLSATINNGVLAPNTTQVVTVSPNVNLSAIGNYNFKSYVIIAGDGNTLNDTLNTVVSNTIATSVPWIEPFATTSIPTGWTTTGWDIGTVRVVNGNPGYNIYKTLYSPFPSGTFSTVSIGPVAANNRLSFDYKLANFSTPFDAPPAGWGNISVQISTNCGSTFTTIDNITDVSTGWVNKTYALSAYAGQFISIRMIATWLSGGYDLGFDNFRVEVPPAIDLIGTGINVTPGACANISLPVSVTLKNNGTSAIDFSTSNALVTVKVTGPAATQNLTATVSNGTLAPNAMQTVMLSPNANLATSGTYNFVSAVTIAGDANPNNDTNTVSKIITTNIAPAPWSEPFASTATPSGWNITGWTIGATGGVTGNPGNNIYKTLYSGSTNGTFTTTSVGVVPVNNSLSFDYKLANLVSPYNAPAAGWGNFKVEISTNCGTTYSSIDSITAVNTGWISKSYSLSAYAGQYVAIRITASWLSGTYNLAFDNFKIDLSPSIDLAATGVNINTGSCPNSDAPVTITIKNVGSSAVNFASNNAVVTVNVTGPAAQTLQATITNGTLAPGVSQTVAVSPNADLYTSGTYNFKSYVTIAGDSYNSNDTATTSKIIAIATAPWTEAFTPNTSPVGWSVNDWAIGAVRGINGNPGNTIYKNFYAGGATTSSFTTISAGPVNGNQKLSFEYKITNYNSIYIGEYDAPGAGWGHFKVQISTDCGISFTTIDSITTSNNFWLSKSYPLAAYIGQIITTRIVSSWANGNYDLAFDNFKIDVPPSVDITCASINLNPGSCPNTSVPVSVTLKNNGTGIINFATNNAFVAAFINSGLYPQTLSKIVSSGILVPNDTVTIALPNNGNFFASGDYTIQSNVAVSGDGNYFNDNAITTARIAFSTTTPWTEPFTANVTPNGWILGNWSLGAARGATGYPGNNVYKHLYSDSTAGTFTTISVSPVQAGNTFRFDYKLSNYTSPYDAPAAGWGNFKVQLSTDCGATFTTIDSITAAGQGWINKSYPLSAYTGQKITARIAATWNAGDYDLAFDNFNVSTSIPLSCTVPVIRNADSITTATTAQIYFNGTGTGFVAEYGLPGFTPGTGATAGTGGTVITTTGSPVTITGLTPATTYQIYIRQNCTSSGSGFSSNSVVDTFRTKQLLLNDLPNTAIVLTVGAGCTGAAYSNAGATRSTNEPSISCSGSQTNGKTVWFKFQAPTSGFVRISTDGSSNTLADTKAALFAATDSSNFTTFQIIACDDDNGVLSSTASIIYVNNLMPGQYYYVAVDDYDGVSTGNFCVKVDEVDTSMIASAGSCTAGQDVPQFRADYKGWASLTNNSGQLIANVRSNTTVSNIVTYSPSVNVHTGAVRQSASGEFYLNRNFRIANPLAGNYDVQFFLLNTELAALQAALPTATLASLNVTKVKNEAACNPNFVSGGTGNDSLLLQTASGTVNSISWITVNTNGFSNFYLHPGTSQLSRLYIFTGNGNWSNPANWSNNEVPPAILPPHSAIEINPVAGGQCIMDIVQRISSTSIFRVKSGTNMIVTGSVIIQ